MNRRQLACFVLCCAVALLASPAFAQFLPGGGVNTPNPNLPPDGVYLTPDQVHAMYTGGALQVVLSAIQHQPFASQSSRHGVPGTNNEVEDFPSSMNGQISVNGSPNQPTSSSGPVQTEVFNKIGQTTGTFQTEMLQLSLNGNSPFGPYMIRESPTLQSLGQTKITDIGGGLFHIDSFFDVFTELSVDGGSSWIPSQGAAHVNLVPEPATVALLGLGLLGLIARRRR
jgi:hypothetical protein